LQKKKVQIRFQTSSSAIGNVNHDFRLSKPNYLRDDMFHNKWDNLYFNFNPHEVKGCIKKSYSEYNQLYKQKHGRNLQKGKQSDLLIGVITLSPIVNSWLKKGQVSKKELEKCFNESIPKIQEKINDILGNKLELFSYVIHYDEKTPHLHFSFSNHTSSGESGFYNIKLSKRLNEFQDVVADVFKEIGLERGDRKSLTKHMSVRQMHQKELTQLQKKIKTLQSRKKILKNEVEDKKQLKEELDEIDNIIREKRNIIKDLKLKKDNLENELTEIDNEKPLLQKKGTKVYPTDEIIEEATKKKFGIKTLDENIIRKYFDFYNEQIRQYNDFKDEVNGLNHPRDLLRINKKLEKENESIKQKQSDIEKNYVTKETYHKLQRNYNDLVEKYKELDLKEKQSQSFLGLNQLLNADVQTLRNELLLYKAKNKLLTEKLEVLNNMQDEHKRMDSLLTRLSDYLNCDDTLLDIENSVKQVLEIKDNKTSRKSKL